MLSGNCTEALSIQANVTISCSSAKLIKNGIAPLPFPLPALLQQYWYIKRGERVRVRGHAQFYATLGEIRPVPHASVQIPNDFLDRIRTTMDDDEEVISTGSSLYGRSSSSSCGCFKFCDQETKFCQVYISLPIYLNCAQDF